MYLVKFPSELQSACFSIHPVRPTSLQLSLITLQSDTNIWFRLGSVGFHRAQRRDNIVEMKDSVLGLKHVLRCILCHVAPPSITKCECLMCAAFAQICFPVNQHTHTHTFICTLFLFACCLVQLFAVICILSSTHTHTMIIDFPLLCPLPSYYQRHGLPLLSVQFTLVGRQCSRAVTNETHSSSIPLFLTWYHMHIRRSGPCWCPEPRTYYRND